MIKNEMDTCCYKALKHGEVICPVCGTTLRQMISAMYNQKSL